MSMPQPSGSRQDQEEPTWQQIIDNPRVSPAPTPRASPGLIAHWVHQGEIDHLDEFTHDSIIRWCNERAVAPMAVLTALNDERSGTRVYSVEDATVAVSDGLWQQWIDDKVVACCPVPRWLIGATTGRQIYPFSDCDDSWRCPKHCKRRAEAILDVARRDWLTLDVVYYAVVAEDLGSINRVRSNRRPARKDAKSWYVARKDQVGWSEAITIHFFSTEDMAGPRTIKPPTSWEPLLPEEAIERLAEALRLPGVVRTSPKWEKKKGGGGEEGDASDVVGSDGTFEDDSPQRDGAEIEPYLALPTVMPGTRAQAMEIADKIVWARHGFRLSEDFIPAEKASVQEIVDYINAALGVVRLNQRKRQ